MENNETEIFFRLKSTLNYSGVKMFRSIQYRTQNNFRDQQKIPAFCHSIYPTTQVDKDPKNDSEIDNIVVSSQQKNSEPELVRHKMVCYG